MEAPRLRRISVVLPKRTRTNVRQSKNGCLTCRARKVKCDETRPICLRCFRSSKNCEGYAARMKRHTSAASHNASIGKQSNDMAYNQPATVIRAISATLPLSGKEASQCRLGFEVLLKQRRECFRWNEQPLWLQLIAQLLPVNDAISSAVISLGAVYDFRCLDVSYTLPSVASKRYQRALAALQKEIASPSSGPIPIFLASVILTAIEVLQQRLVNAMMHLQGAFVALGYLSDTWPEHQLGLEDKNELKGSQGVEGHLHSLAQSLDLQRAWYALGQPPQLPRSFRASIPSLGEEENVQSLLHACYHFSNRAAEFKYRSSSQTPSSLTLEQGRYIATLTNWLTGSTSPAHSWKKSDGRKSLILRVQCLSTFVYLSTILSPDETAYDLYTAHFCTVVDISEYVVNLSGRSPAFPLPPFQLQPGIFQAIYFTAMKCRDPQLRRRAIALMSHVGIEGPWNPQVMIPVAERAVEIEETNMQSQGLDDYQGCYVPATQRLHGCGLDASLPTTDETLNHILVRFSLCRDVEYMVQSPNFADPKHWIIWSEVLQPKDTPGLAS